MTRKRQRMIYVVAGMVALGFATGLVLFSLGDNLVFFYSPTDVLQKGAPANRTFRIGGLVEMGSVEHVAADQVRFVVTDTANTMKVSYQGVLPSLFREGQGVVAEGRVDAAGVFVAQQVLAKHDETYMPPEVVDALKKSGEWRGN